MKSDINCVLGNIYISGWIWQYKYDLGKIVNFAGWFLICFYHYDNATNPHTIDKVILNFFPDPLDPPPWPRHCPWLPRTPHFWRREYFLRNTWRWSNRLQIDDKDFRMESKNDWYPTSVPRWILHAAEVASGESYFPLRRECIDQFDLCNAEFKAL